ncbi:putative 24-methylenesterol C-methyltransferase [Helianthus annuus]|nr:putative 24-methylenesterol C-methyltransferase [Helianthus annuus]
MFLQVCWKWVTTELFNGEDSEYVEVIQVIERGDALPGLRNYSDIADVAKKVRFEVVKEKDLAKPLAGPWWLRLKMGGIAYWRNHVVVTMLEAIGVAPKGTVDVHEMLFKTADYLTRGGESGIFTPMHMILYRKPEKVQES